MKVLVRFEQGARVIREAVCETDGINVKIPQAFWSGLPLMHGGRVRVTDYQPS